jgi:hypothetical protein
MNKIDSTSVFEALLRGEDYKLLHQEIVVKPSIEIVKRFLEETTHAFENTKYSNYIHIYIYIYNIINYTLMKGKQTTSCSVNPFWMAKPILLNTTSKDLGEQMHENNGFMSFCIEQELCCLESKNK